MIALVNTETEEYISVIPEFGGTISAIVLRRSGALYPLLDGYTEKEDFLGNDAFRGVHLIPFASRIHEGRYNFRGRRFQLPINDPGFGCAIHGFFRNRPVRLEETTIDEEKITARFSASYHGDVKGYPFPFETAITCALAGTGGVSCSVEIRNAGPVAMPLGVGWHPYFQLGGTVDGMTLELPVKEQIPLNHHMIPVATRTAAGDFAGGVSMNGRHIDGIFPIDPARTAGGRALTKLRNPVSGACLNLWQETGREKFNYIVVYTPPDRRSIALEPLTSNVDAFNNGEGLIVLEPGGVFRGSYGISLS